MHLAVFVGPPRAAKDDVLPPSGALGLKLARAGYRLVHVALGDELEPSLRSAIAGAGEGDSLLVYVAGTMELDDAKLAMRLVPRSGSVPPSSKQGGTRSSVPLGAVGDAVRGRAAKDTLLVLDVAHDEPEADAMRASEYVQAAIDTFDARKNGLEMLVAAGAVGQNGAAWPFTKLFAEAVDDPLSKDSNGVTSAARVCALLRANGTLTDFVPSFAHVKAAREFVLFPASPRISVTEVAVAPALASAPASAPAPAPAPASAPAPAPAPAPASVPDPPVSARTRSVPPPQSGASLDMLVALADDAWNRNEWDDAFSAYKRALMVTPEGDAPRRALIYMRFGEVKRRQHKPREAELNFEKVLEIDKTSRAAHEALIALAAEGNDARRTVTLRKRAREALDDVTQLPLIADLLETKLKDEKGAIAALEEARGLLPGDTSVLERLRRLYEAKGLWRKLVEVTGELATATNDPKARAALRFAQADVTLGRLLDEDKGLSLLEAALEDDPTHDKALGALVAVRTRRKELPLLDATYAKLVDCFAVSGDAERAWQTCKKLGLMRRDAMGDPKGAADAFAGAVKCKPSDVESRAALADLAMSRGDLDEAQAELVRMSRIEPLRVATYRKLYDVHTKKGNTDRAWLAATALDELEAADIDHHLVIDQYRAHHTEVVRPTAVFDERIRREDLRAEGADEFVAAILRVVGRAAAALRVTELRKDKQLISLRPESRQEETSTASIVRTFVWASKVLDVPLPELHMLPDVPGGLAAVRGDARATAIGPDVRSGLPLQELAFIVARHLTYYRPEHYALVFYATLPELLALFLSAVEVALPAMPLSSRSGASGKKLVKSLDKQLTDAERDELGKAAARFEEAGGRVDLAGWNPWGRAHRDPRGLRPRRRPRRRDARAAEGDARHRGPVGGRQARRLARVLGVGGVREAPGGAVAHGEAGEFLGRHRRGGVSSARYPAPRRFDAGRQGPPPGFGSGPHGAPSPPWPNPPTRSRTWRGLASRCAPLWPGRPVGPSPSLALSAYEYRTGPAREGKACANSARPAAQTRPSSGRRPEPSPLRSERVPIHLVHRQLAPQRHQLRHAPASRLVPRERAVGLAAVDLE